MSTFDQQLADAREAGRADAQHALIGEQANTLLRMALSARGADGSDLDDLVTAANPTAFIVDGKVSPDKISAYAARIAESPNRVRDSAGGRSVAAGRNLHRDRKTSTRSSEAR